MQIATFRTTVRVLFNPLAILGGSATPGPATPNIRILYRHRSKP